MSASPSVLASLGLTGKSRKVKHRKVTAEKWAVLEREADLRAQIRRNKVIAAEIGCTEMYVAHQISRLVQERLGKVPRLAHVHALEKNEKLGN